MKPQTEFEVMRINGPVFADRPVVFAKSSPEAVYKAFGTYAVISGDNNVQYHTTNLATGRKAFLRDIEKRQPTREGLEGK